MKKTQFADYPYNHLRERFKTRLSDQGFNLLNRSVDLQTLVVLHLLKNLAIYPFFFLTSYFFFPPRFLTYNPPKRITCQEGLYHEYFDKEPPLPIDPAMFPTWPAKSENPHGRSKKTGISPKPPSGGKNFKDLVRLLKSLGILLCIFMGGILGVLFNTFGDEWLLEIAQHMPLLVRLYKLLHELFNVYVGAFRLSKRISCNSLPRIEY